VFFADTLLSLLRVLGLAATRHYYMSKVLPVSADAGSIAVYITIFQEIEMACSVSAATVITLRPLSREFNTGFGLGGETVGNYGTTKYGVGTGASARGGSLFGASRPAESHVTSGSSTKLGKRRVISSVGEPKESEEYILEDQEEDKIYKQTSYTVRTEAVKDDDRKAGRHSRR
jgi:hypothetical protein